jgi:hypothetical protein
MPAGGTGGAVDEWEAATTVRRRRPKDPRGDGAPRPSRAHRQSAAITARGSRVVIRPPVARDRDAFLAAMRASRRLHRGSPSC